MARARAESRGVEDGESVCARLASCLESAEVDAAAGSDSPESVFARLGGSS